MTKEEYLEELNKAFGDFKFYEENHTYTYKDKPISIGATGLIEQYCNEFDSQGIAEKVAIRDNKSVQEVLDEWKKKNKWACRKGSIIHETSQYKWKNKYDHVIFPIPTYTEEEIPILEKLRTQAYHFFYDYKDRLEHLADEFVIGSADFDICSAVDHLFINKLTGGLVLVDYKTNSYMSGYNKKAYKKAMKIPLQHLNDDALHHYHIQLSIYKYIVEKYTNLKIEEMFIVYMSENIENYEIIQIPYMKKEVEKILENRRVKNMKSVPVLIIGKSGSGKSASLRNFKKDEIAIANVLGKPLPFKSNLEAPKVDDYATILRAVEHTDKKVIVIDDANYLITNEFMNKSTVKGFDKYNEMGNNFFNLINGIKNIEGGKTVYLIMHEDTDEDGNIKPKTIGKLLDDKVNIQGMFTICLRAMFDNGNYIFRLKTNGQDCVKTPIGLFEEEQIENDLKLIDKKIREYYELDKKVEEK